MPPFLGLFLCLFVCLNSGLFVLLFTVCFQNRESVELIGGELGRLLEEMRERNHDQNIA